MRNGDCDGNFGSHVWASLANCNPCQAHLDWESQYIADEVYATAFCSHCAYDEHVHLSSQRWSLSSADRRLPLLDGLGHGRDIYCKKTSSILFSICWMCFLFNYKHKYRIKEWYIWVTIITRSESEFLLGSVRWIELVSALLNRPNGLFDARLRGLPLLLQRP